MCHSCYLKLTGDEPVERTEAVIRAGHLANQVYELPHCGTGGPLHVQLDDMNLEDEHFLPTDRPGLDEVIDTWYPELRRIPGAVDLIFQTWDALAALTEAERAEAVFHRESF
jgi:hypothetical protein